MAQAEIKEILSVDRAKLFGAITKYEDYPKFVDGVKSVQVLERGSGFAKVKYHVSIMRDILYTIDLRENAEAGTVSWTLVESDFFKKNNGSWQLKDAGSGKTEAFYKVEMEFNIMVPNMILNKLIKGSLPSMLRNFESQAKKG